MASPNRAVRVAASALAIGNAAGFSPSPTTGSAHASPARTAPPHAITPEALNHLAQAAGDFMMDAAKEVMHGAEEALGAGFAAGVGGAILKRRQDGESDKGSNKGSDPPSRFTHYGSPEAQAASAAASVRLRRRGLSERPTRRLRWQHGPELETIA